MNGRAFGGAIVVDDHSSEQHLADAARALASGDGVVVLQNILVLRASGAGLACEVIDPLPGAHRCDEEFKVLIENASRMLQASELAPLLPAKPRTWSVVEDNGTEVLEVWRWRGS